MTVGAFGFVVVALFAEIVVFSMFISFSRRYRSVIVIVIVAVTSAKTISIPFSKHLALLLRDVFFL